jgi:hypothetical protein
MRAGRGASDHVPVRLLLPDGNSGRHQERAEEGDHEARRDRAPQRHAVDERIEVKTDADADAWVKKIPPIRQWELAKIIADPPVLVKDDKAKGDDPNASPAANPTGESSPPSSENTGPASDPEA